MRKLKVTIKGGTAGEQADTLRSIAFSVQEDSEWLFSGQRHIRAFPASGNSTQYRVAVVEIADYDREILATAWFRSRFGSHNKLARATDIADDRLALILLGEKRATVPELARLCHELNISVESLSSQEEKA